MIGASTELFMNKNTIRAKVDRELTNRVGKWFTVRQIQDKLRINPSTLKPLLMKYARENVLKRRKVKGTARAVEFTPAATSSNTFQAVLTRFMPYRNFSSTSKKFGGSRGGRTITARTAVRKTTARKTTAKRRR